MIKFEYDYSLCKGVSSNKINPSSNGKLTLRSVSFSSFIYKDANGNYVAEYLPGSKYSFDYAQMYDPNWVVSGSSNKDYDAAYTDRWGMYQENRAGSNWNEFGSNALYPYAAQSLSDLEQDIKATVWNLTRVCLPAGGRF